MVLIAAAFALAACEPPLHFTEKPLPGLDGSQTREKQSAIFVDVGLDKPSLLLAMRKAVPPQRKRIVGWTRNAACVTRGRSKRCYGGRIDARFPQRPVLTMAPRADGTLRLTLSYRANIATRGLKAARSQRAAYTRVVEVSRDLALAFGPGYVPSLAPVSGLDWSATKVPVLKASFDLRPKLAYRAKQAMRRVQAALADALAAASMPVSVSRAWQLAAKPIAFRTDRDAWLALAPAAIAPTGFVAAGDDLAVRLAIAGRLSVGAGDPPDAVIAKALPKIAAPGQSEPAPDPQPLPKVTALPLTIPVDLAPIKDRVAAAFPKGEVVSTRAHALSPPIELRIDGATLGGSQRLLTLELKAEVLSPPRFADLAGRVHLVGRPTFADGGGALTLEGVAFPTLGEPGVRRPETPVPLGAEPFASRFRDAVQMAAGQSFAKALKQVSDALDKDLGADVHAGATFADVDIDGVRAFHAGRLDVLVTLRGQLRLAIKPGRPDATAALETDDGAPATTNR
ncbi:MAG: DUF4403 family protein [Pseudomonadota bacterium]